MSRNTAKRSFSAGAATVGRWPIRSCTSGCADGSRCGCGASAAAGCCDEETYSGPVTISAYERFQNVRDLLAKEGINVPLPTGN